MNGDEIKAVEIREQQIEKGTKWNWSKAVLGFWKLLVDPATIAFAVFTIFAWKILNVSGIAKGHEGLIIKGWIIMSCLFVVFASLKKAISTAIENAKINADFKVFNTAEKAAEAVKNLSK